MATVLFRQENFVNLCYEIACLAPHSLPLFIQRRLAKVFHYGGVHSATGTAAVVWFLLYTALATKDWFNNRDSSKLPDLILCYIIVLMFCTILAAAHPSFRRLFHDYFEAGHRFASWTTLIIFWVHNGLAARSTAKVEDIPVGEYLIRSPNFWFFIISTSCTLLSWCRLRRRDVYPEVLLDHAIRLHFKYRDMQPFYGLKVD